ncbi:hypothetical protein BV22DRAFT_1095929 [Leucogyrophana mollusca]|uniref:Uncharacterized protein n=1 Tax=Leucogyrophana mollusca TaxID=85980 RepID=A0ACB8B955_9AGAM|nr:hypothetical protein BV22DRAFT_1095929 [Leucogyrophana mollusca]
MTVMAALVSRIRHGRRLLSTSALNVDALDRWIASPKSLTLSDTLTPRHLASLYITLPTRDGTRASDRPYTPPAVGTPVPFGHHLAFFHPHNPESVLRSDGTDADFCPPSPFTRRMWAGGKMRWNNSNPLLVGAQATAVSSVEEVQKKGFEGGTGNPMVFVQQKIEVSMEGQKEASVIEERSHVYLAFGGNRRTAREVRGLPVPDFAFKYTPTPTTLFRFSALTFNGHYIHLDKDYAQQSEGYPERLVHGPLTALMLLEALQFQRPGICFHNFEYRAQNPVIVNQPQTIYGSWTGQAMVDLWAVDDDGIVGMTGRVTILPEERV